MKSSLLIFFLLSLITLQFNNVVAKNKDGNGYSEEGERDSDFENPGTVSAPLNDPSLTPASFRNYNYSGDMCDGFTVSYNPSSNIKIMFVGQFLQRFDLNPSNYKAIHKLGCWLKQNDVDYILTDLETAILAPLNTSVRLEEVVNNVTPSLSSTSVLDLLSRVYSINLLGLANNHIFDLGVAGFEYTQQQLAARNIPFAGAGKNKTSAAQPIFLPLRNPSKTLALHNVVSAPSLNVFGGCATNIQEGINCMQLDSDINPVNVDADSQALQYQMIQQSCQAADISIVMHHNHYNNRNNSYNRLAWETDFREGTIDNGAAFYLGHGNAILLGIETYRHALVFHNLGSLAFQTSKSGGYQPQYFESVMVLVELDRDTTRIVSANIWPVALSGYPEGKTTSTPGYWQNLGLPNFSPSSTQPNILFAPVEQGMATLYRLKGMSAELGTNIEIDDTTVTAKIVFEKSFLRAKPASSLHCKRYGDGRRNDD